MRLYDFSIENFESLALKIAKYANLLLKIWLRKSSKIYFVKQIIYENLFHLIGLMIGSKI